MNIATLTSLADAVTAAEAAHVSNLERYLNAAANEKYVFAEQVSSIMARMDKPSVSGAEKDAKTSQAYLAACTQAIAAEVAHATSRYAIDAARRKYDIGVIELSSSK